MGQSTRQTRTSPPAAQKRTDVRVIGASLYLIPVQTRVPLKFGPETLTSVTCARVRIEIRDKDGRTAHGWGETPLSVQWAWPSTLSVAERQDAMIRFCKELTTALSQADVWGHPLEIGHSFLQTLLPALRLRFNEGADPSRRIPLLASLVCLSAFDIALHDAFGVLHDCLLYTSDAADE